jgi:hypothetical protein
VAALHSERGAAQLRCLAAWRVNSRQQGAPTPPCGGSPKPRPAQGCPSFGGRRGGRTGGLGCLELPRLGPPDQEAQPPMPPTCFGEDPFFMSCAGCWCESNGPSPCTASYHIGVESPRPTHEVRKRRSTAPGSPHPSPTAQAGWEARAVLLQRSGRRPGGVPARAAMRRGWRLTPLVQLCGTEPSARLRLIRARSARTEPVRMPLTSTLLARPYLATPGGVREEVSVR